MCEGGCIYLSPMSRGAPPVPSKSVYICEGWLLISQVEVTLFDFYTQKYSF